MKKYLAVYEREPDGRWTVEIPDVPGCHTYGRTIDQARERVREALALYVDNADTAEIVDEVKFPVKVRRLLATVKQVREQYKRAESAMTDAQAEVVKVLRREMKLGHRDAGHLLGLSHQRIHQIEQAASAVERRRRKAKM